MIIGLTGTNGAGKSTAVEFLKKTGFEYYSHSDEIREELKKREIPETRLALIEMGNTLRKEFGPRVLAARIKKKILVRRPEISNFIVDSIRNPAEVEELRKLPGFILVAVDAAIETRFKRVMERQLRGERNESAITLEDFQRIEQKEMSQDPAGQQLHKVIKMADILVINDGSVEELQKKIWKLIDKTQRISLDEYFLKIASVVAERSTCRRHNVGAVLVKDKHIISTGYNGAAAGTKDCLELNCLRNEMKIPSGQRHEICRAIHAEQNSIIQAGLHGKSTQGATLYCTHSPCILCAKILVNARISRFVTYAEYADDSFQALFKEAGIEFIKMPAPERVIRFRG